MATTLPQPAEQTGDSSESYLPIERNGVPGPPSAKDFSIDEFLRSEREKDMLRFSTAGSVDDGKSTLIGRLLYDSRNVYEDHVRSVTRSHGGAARSAIDFAQLTDGLRAEREQGITIDVAYRYFSTGRRKFVIADTPGHEQYTRNMATGASTADLAVILLDASKGILTQSRRHVYITSLLGIRHLVAAVNKMDLVDCSAEVFYRLEREFTTLVHQLGNAEVKAIPVSALDGDNVVERGARMPWYTGPTLLEYLENVPTQHQSGGLAFRLPVQRVIRTGGDDPKRNFRGFAGQIAAGTVSVGDNVVALPSGRVTKIASICTFDGNLPQASAPQSIALTLEEEIDVSRGDVIAEAGNPPSSGNLLTASLVWFDDRNDAQASGKPGSFLLKHAAETVSARIARIRHRVNVTTLEQETADSLKMNDIALVEVETSRPIFFDPYESNRATGSFILIDAETNATSAAGMIHSSRNDSSGEGAAAHREPAGQKNVGAAVVAGSELAPLVESELHRLGIQAVRTRLTDPQRWRALAEAGFLVIAEADQEGQGIARLAIFPAGQDRTQWESVETDGEQTSTAVVALLVDRLRSLGVIGAEGHA